MELVELEKIYRQHDDQFIKLLNAIRNKTVSVSEEALGLLNQRYLPQEEKIFRDFPKNCPKRVLTTRYFRV